MFKRKHKYGFVLSGGGAKSFAHLGVIKALREHGVEPDIYSATSGGALAATLLSDGYEPDEILSFFEKLGFRDFTDFVFPLSGISRTTRIEELLKKYLRARTFEDLRVPVSITASNFDTGVAEHFSSGDLLEPLIASCCIPIVYIPKKIKEVHYVDGGLFQNMPVSPIRKKCRKIVAINVNPLASASHEEGSLRSILERTIHLVIHSNTESDKQLADIYIEPKELTNYSLYAIHKSKDIFEVGYRFTKEMIASKSIKL